MRTELKAVEKFNKSFQTAQNQKTLMSTATDQPKDETESGVKAQFSDRWALNATALKCVGFTQADDQLKVRNSMGAPRPSLRKANGLRRMARK